MLSDNGSKFLDISCSIGGTFSAVESCSYWTLSSALNQNFNNPQKFLWFENVCFPMDLYVRVIVYSSWGNILSPTQNSILKIVNIRNISNTTQIIGTACYISALQYIWLWSRVFRSRRIELITITKNSQCIIIITYNFRYLPISQWWASCTLNYL